MLNTPRSGGAKERRSYKIEVAVFVGEQQAARKARWEWDIKPNAKIGFHFTPLELGPREHSIAVQKQKDDKKGRWDDPRLEQSSTYRIQYIRRAEYSCDFGAWLRACACCPDAQSRQKTDRKKKPEKTE